MLTVDVKALAPNHAHSFWLIELDWEHGTVQHLGEGEIYPAYDGHRNFGVESLVTGGGYLEATIVGGDVELWIAEEHYLAVFATEDAMHRGGAALVAAFGNEMPVGIYGSLV